MSNRWDETWHRLREWTNGQAPSERLAAQMLLSEGYESLDPSHPLGGPDGGRDAACKKDGKTWLMAVYFPRGQEGFGAIKNKLLVDLTGVSKNHAHGLVFVTNQELALAERRDLQVAAHPVPVELYHLERITAVLDAPVMAGVRRQFLGIDFDADSAVTAVRDEIVAMQRRLEAVQTGGDTFCYWMLYHFDLTERVARNFVIIRHGEFPLYDVRFRITDMGSNRDVFKRAWGELNSPADFLLLKWPLPDSAYYRVFFHARNGSWNQDLILRRSDVAGHWLAATRVRGKTAIVFEEVSDEYVSYFGKPEWRS